MRQRNRLPEELLVSDTGRLEYDECPPHSIVVGQIQNASRNPVKVKYPSVLYAVDHPLGHLGGNGAIPQQVIPAMGTFQSV